MTPTTDDRQELEALTDLIAHCRDSARARGEATLAYHLDMAFAAARGDADRDEGTSAQDSPRDPLATFGAATGSGERRPLDLKTIRTAIEGCLDRAQDLDRRILDYTLGMALLAAREAIGTRTYS